MARYLSCSRRRIEVQKERAAYDQQQYFVVPSSSNQQPSSKRKTPKNKAGNSNATSSKNTLARKKRGKCNSDRAGEPESGRSTGNCRRASNSQYLASSTASLQQLADENRFYVIEKLIDKRFTNGCEEYLVRWQNYPPEWDSWEPRAELERNALDMINEYNKTSQPRADDDTPQCICKRPYRFDQGGMIQCFNCHEWYHFTCLGMNMAEANAYAKWNCVECRRANPSLTNLIKPEKQNRLGEIIH